MAKILIVEDNALNIKLFCDLLAAHGHEPKAVTDSRQALDLALGFSPDLVITDIQLPHVNGLELIRMLRADQDLSEVPIMAVTLPFGSIRTCAVSPVITGMEPEVPVGSMYAAKPSPR